MKGAPGGFTVIEVMIVLSISAVMLVTAIAAFSGRRENTDFTQAVYDLRSHLQSIANNVSSQSVPGLENYRCTPATVGGILRPTLSTNTPTGEDCIYIGQALQLAPNTSNIYSYPVLGLRTIPGSTSLEDPPTTPAEAHAEPAIDSSGNIIAQLKETYVMLNDLKVVSAQLSGAESDILTFYSNLKTNNTSGNDIDVLATSVTGSSSDPDTQVKNCVEGTSCPSLTNVNNSYWNLCVSMGARQAMVSLKGTATGIVTKLNMNGCA